MAIVKVNGVDTFTCWDSGSELDAISPDFIQATGITPKAKDNLMKVRLATKGSTSTTLYEVEVNLDFRGASIDHPLKVLNLNHWDMILGSYFCEHHNVHLDYNTQTIQFSDVVIKALSKDEEVSTMRRAQGTQKGPIEPMTTALSTTN